MFEFSIAFKYLLPRRRQLSVSIISLISVLVIALVVWLIVVFFSVTRGLEKSWVQKLISLTAPVRVLPTQKYYDSYYYLADSISANAGYRTKSIREKIEAEFSDPYDPEFDEEIPSGWPPPDLDGEGRVKDLVKLAFAGIRSIQGIEELAAKEYETTIADLQLFNETSSTEPQEAVSQAVYLASYDPSNTYLASSILADDENSPDFFTEARTLPSSLPNDSASGEGILLPKQYKNLGIKRGSRGFFSYHIATMGAIQKQSIPITVAGFFDPGIFPLGSRVALANGDVVAMISSAITQKETLLKNGIHVRFANLDAADGVKKKIEDALNKAGVGEYWSVETFHEFPFTKDFLQQLKSERNLFILISAVIIIVACSNILSMLILLVNDKKSEIGILRSMGASSLSIAAIFGIAGFLMGAIGGLIGIFAGLATLRNLQALIGFISRMQGFDAFNPLFFGETLPNQINIETLIFVLLATSLISLVAGIVPAVKACLLKPATILRSE